MRLRLKTIGMKMLSIFLILVAMYFFLLTQFGPWNDSAIARWGGFILAWTLIPIAYWLYRRAQTGPQVRFDGDGGD
jgi:hypothetical protein